MLAELARSGSLAERSAWAARWAARLTGADSAILFTIDADQGASSPPEPSARRRPRPCAVRPRASRASRATSCETAGSALSGRVRPPSTIRCSPRCPGAPRPSSSRPFLSRGRAVAAGRPRIERGPGPGAARGSRAFPPPRGRGRRQGPRGRPEIGGDAPGHRAPHEPVRPVEGLRVDDRPLRARHPHRPEGLRLLCLRDGLALVPRERF